MALYHKFAKNFKLLFWPIFKYVNLRYQDMFKQKCAALDIEKKCKKPTIAHNFYNLQNFLMKLYSFTLCIISDIPTFFVITPFINRERGKSNKNETSVTKSSIE